MAVTGVKDALSQIKRRKMRILRGRIPAVFNSYEIAFIASNMNEIAKTAEALAVVVLDQQKRIEELENKLKGATEDGKDT